jgi:hypothetical protein
MNGTPRLAPNSREAVSGNGRTSRAGTVAYSCAVPSKRLKATSHNHTLSPGTTSSTPGPTASTIPEPSRCGT